MEINIYLKELIYAFASSLLIFLALFLITKNILSTSWTRMYFYLLLSIVIVVLMTTYFDAQLNNLITNNINIWEYSIWKTIIEWIWFSILFIFLMRWHFYDWKYIFLWIICLSSYIIVTYYFTPWIFGLYNLIMELSNKFL